MLLDILLSKGPAADQKLRVLSEWSGLLFNRLIHPRLSEMRLISLIMTITTVADDIDNDVTFILRAIVSCKLADKVDSFNIVTIDMEDWRVYGLRNVGGVGSGTRETRVGS